MKSLFAIVAPGLGIDPRIPRALEFLRDHSKEHVTLAQVAEHAHLSPSRLEHLLATQTGKTFSAHLKKFRLNEAEALLADWSLHIRQIAFHCGYESVPSFTRAFKRRYRLSPSLYRLSRFG